MMKKVLFFSPTGSIHSRFNLANINAIGELGYEIHLLANFENGPGPEGKNESFAQWCKEQGYYVHNMPFVRGASLKNFSLVKELKKFLRKEQFDIVHAHTETGGLLLRLAYSAKSSSKFIYTAHGMSFWKGCPLKNRIFYKTIEKWICRGMDANLGMNQEELSFLQKLNPKTAFYVHGIGLNLERFQKVCRLRSEVRAEFGLKEDDKFIVSVGELDDNKNHATVIKALSLLENREFKYVICGVGPNRDMLLKMAEVADMKDKVILAGYRSDIPDILHAADLFVFPSFHEGLPVSALEAMACGLPVICSRIRGNVDIVKDGENGFLFEPEDDTTLVLQIERLINSQELARRFGEKNKQIVREFSQEAVVEELMKLYSI